MPDFRAQVDDFLAVLIGEPIPVASVRQQLHPHPVGVQRQQVGDLAAVVRRDLAERIADEMFVMAKGRIVYQAPIAQFKNEIESVKSQYLTL